MLGIRRPDSHALPRIPPTKRADRDACSPPASGFVPRRISPTPARPGEGLLSDHIAGVRPVRIRPANSGQPIAFATRGCPHVMAENGVCHVVG